MTADSPRVEKLAGSIFTDLKFRTSDGQVLTVSVEGNEQYIVVVSDEQAVEAVLTHDRTVRVSLNAVVHFDGISTEHNISYLGETVFGLIPISADVSESYLKVEVFLDRSPTTRVESYTITFRRPV